MDYAHVYDTSMGGRVVQMQTLILHGSDDLMAPVINAHTLGEAIPDSRVEITPSGRHGFFDEFADSVSPRVLRFLGDR